MQFSKLTSNVILCRPSQAMMAAKATEIETKIGGEWKHDANDSDKPMVSYQ